MSIAIAPTAPKPLASCAKHSPAPTVQKGDDKACAKYVRWYAKEHNVSLRYAGYCVWCQYVDWSYPEKEIKWWQS